MAVKKIRKKVKEKGKKKKLSAKKPISVKEEKNVLKKIQKKVVVKHTVIKKKKAVVKRKDKKKKVLADKNILVKDYAAVKKKRKVLKKPVINNIVIKKKKVSTDKVTLSVLKTRISSPPIVKKHLENLRRERENIRLPQFYKEDKIVVMVVDPWYIHTYWELKESSVNEAGIKLINQGADSFVKILRVYEIDAILGMSSIKNYFDIKLNDSAFNWYINTAMPGTSWCIDIGLLGNNGMFLAIARSNCVNTPRYGISDEIDKEWGSLENMEFELSPVSS